MRKTSKKKKIIKTKQNEEAKVEDAKTYEVKVEEAKTYEVKVEEAKVEEAKTYEVKAEEAKTYEVKAEEAKTYEVKVEDVENKYLCFPEPGEIHEPDIESDDERYTDETDKVNRLINNYKNHNSEVNEIENLTNYLDDVYIFNGLGDFNDEEEPNNNLTNNNLTNNSQPNLDLTNGEVVENDLLNCIVDMMNRHRGNIENEDNEIRVNEDNEDDVNEDNEDGVNADGVTEIVEDGVIADGVNADGVIEIVEDKEIIETSKPLPVEVIKLSRDLQFSDLLRNFINNNKFKKIINSDFSLDKIAGLVFGCALADSIGIQNINRNNIITGPSNNTSRSYTAGDWSSNTDQLIINLDLLTSGKMNYKYELLVSKLLYWKNNGFKELGDHEGIGIKRLTAYVLSQPDYENDPVKCATVSYKNMDNTFAPNDALIRSAILAININWGKYIVKQCALTHIDNRCIYTSWIFCLVINCINKGIYPELEELFKDHKIFLQLELHLLEFDKYYKYFNLWNERKNELMEFKMLDVLNISDLYETSYIFKSLGIIIYTYLILKNKNDNNLNDNNLNENENENENFYKSVVLNVVNKGGDSEVNGGIVGALLGVYIGYLNLPEDWIQTLINRKWLENKVKMLLSHVAL